MCAICSRRHAVHRSHTRNQLGEITMSNCIHEFPVLTTDETDVVDIAYERMAAWDSYVAALLGGWMANPVTEDGECTMADLAGYADRMLAERDVRFGTK
jgi:hypothetical protein